MNEREQALKRYFGHSSFWPGQAELIDALLAGRDAVGVMPTGAGKSVCYQLPAVLLPGLALVISPLISLMKDQVEALGQAGVPAAFLNSTQSLPEYRSTLDRARAGAYKLLYVAPERLETEGFQALAAETQLSLVAVDEAHCVSQWGQDFRPSYLKISEFLRSLPARPPVGAFTATATEQVRADIVRLLGLRDPLCVTTGFDRPNLYLEVRRPQKKLPTLIRLLRKYEGRSGIVYCATRKTVEQVCNALRAEGFAATRYHAGLSDEERRENQEDFVYDRARVMVATNAFGMGIDKSNVGFVIHYNMPKNLEAYYQEAGRAGRDGAPADCVLLFSAGDITTNRRLIEHSRENEPLDPEARDLYLRQEYARLDRMAEYCRTDRCLRSYILTYFGEDAPGPCGNCGSCRAEFEERDITVEAQKIFSCILRVERLLGYSLGAGMLVPILRGRSNDRIHSLGLDRLPTFGALSDRTAAQLRALLDQLTDRGWLLREGGDHPYLRCAPEAADVLFHGAPVVIRVPVEPDESPAPEMAVSSPPRRSAGAASRDDAVVDEALLARLKELRLRLAREASIPAYLIFTNATLNAMAARQPTDEAAFLSLPGVGEIKAARYAAPFLQAIAEWQRDHS